MTCDDFNNIYYDEIEVVNKSNETIYLLCSQFDSHRYVYNRLMHGWFDDTLNPNTAPLKIPIDSWYNKLSKEENLAKRDTARYRLLIFCQSTIDKYGTEEIAKKGIFDKEYVYTYNSIKAQDFKIVYDGK